MSFCQYSIDENNDIYNIGGNWADFATQNNGSRSIEDDVVGTSLWSHIHGLDVKSYLNAIFFAVRKVQIPVVLPYRCDSPTQPRQFIMAVLPAGGERLKIDHLSVLTEVVSPASVGSQFGTEYASM